MTAGLLEGELLYLLLHRHTPVAHKGLADIHLCAYMCIGTCVWVFEEIYVQDDASI